MRKEKPLPKESSFKEYSDNRPKSSSNLKPRGISRSVAKIIKSDSKDKGGKPDRRQSRGNSFKEDRRQSRPRTSGFNNRNRQGGDREMFDAICSKCKKPCKVPFKPTTGKPVSCSDCFVRKDRNDGSRRSGGFSGNRDSGPTGMTRSRSGPRSGGFSRGRDSRRSNSRNSDGRNAGSIKMTRSRSSPRRRPSSNTSRGRR